MRTYGELVTAKDGKAWAITRCEPHVAIRLKHIFPRIPKASLPPYVFPADDLHAADLSWFLQRYPLAIDDRTRQAIETGRGLFERTQAEIERILTPGYKAPAFIGLKPGQVVRDYQGQAIDVLMASCGLLLADEVGLGKTYTAAGAMLRPGTLPAVAVCQPHLQDQWAEKIGEFTALRVHKIRGTRPYSLPEADVYLFRYSQLGGWVNIFPELKPNLVVWDEVQELRTGTDTDKGRASRVLSRLAAFRLGLSATPIFNYGKEIWQILQFIAPDVLGPYHDFLREWCNNGRGIDDPDALGTFLRERHCFLRRTKRDVGQQMPPVNIIVHEVEHDAGELRAIEDMARDLALRTTFGRFEERGNAARELDMLVRQQTGIAKAPAVADFLRMLVEGGEPVLCAGWHREVYRIWNERLHDLNPVMYTGTESTRQKEINKARFLSGESDLMFISLRSGSGLDGLQARCNTAVVGELDWSPGIHHQFFGRLDREGQAVPVTGFFLVTNDGSDPPIMELNGLKKAESAPILDPGLGVQPVHSDVSRMRLLAQRYLTRQERTRAAAEAAQAAA